MARRRKGDKVDGWINLDKPSGMTSTQAMSKVRRILNAQKAGHAGTLDPLATGILPIALGEATKTIPFVQDSLKTYSFTIGWGEQRDTDDSEGKIIAASPVRPERGAIEALLPAYTGVVTQIPPQFSAIKVDGQRAYDLARDGEEVELKPREVYIQKLEIIRHPGESRGLSPLDQKIPACAGMTDEKAGMTEDQTSFRMICGKGTYVRALARDMARDLGTYGHITALRREKVGPFSESGAISLDILEKMGDSAALKDAVLPLDAALDDIPALVLKQEEGAKLRNGQSLSFIARPDFERLRQAGLESRDKPLATLAILAGKPVALVEIKGPDIKPVRIINT